MLKYLWAMKSLIRLWSLLALISGSCLAGTNVWTTGGPYGGSVSFLAIDPACPSTLYAGTEYFGLFKTVNGGESWTSVSTGLTSPYLTALAISHSDPLTLYAGTQYEGVFKTTDGGESWRSINNGLNQQEIYYGLNALAIDPSNPSTVYAGTNYNLYKTTDGGNTWNASNTGLWYTGIVSLAIDPSTPLTVYAGTLGGIYKSYDGGEHWNAAYAGLTNYSHAIAIDPSATSTIYTGAYDGVFKTTDAGASWEPANKGLEGLTIYALSIDPSTPSTVYAGSNYGLFKTTDGGENWDSTPTGSKNPGINAISIDPLNPSVVFVGSDVLLYYNATTTETAGLFKTTDGGGSWNPEIIGLTGIAVWALAVDPSSISTMYAGTDCGVFMTTDGGGTWNALNIGNFCIPVFALAIDPNSPLTIFAGTWNIGLLKTVDGGLTWADANGGLPWSGVSLLSADTSAPSDIYAASYTDSEIGYFPNGLCKTSDGGENWNCDNPGLTNPYIEALAIDPISPSTLYVGAWPFDSGAAIGYNLFKTTDGGETWNVEINGLPNVMISSIAIDPLTPSTVYAGTCYGCQEGGGGKGLYKTTDGGDHWNAVNRGLTNMGILSLVIDPSSPLNVYAGTYNDISNPGGVFKSTNGGESWKPDGLHGLQVNALAFPKSHPSIVYAGTSQGVWSITMTSHERPMERP